MAKLGWTATKNIVEEICGGLKQVKIHRIDFCADFYGISVLSLAENICLPGTHGLRLYKNRKGVTYYLQSSALRSVLVYDKSPSLKRTRKLIPNIEITRFEVQLRGKAVPIRDFEQLNRYSEVDLIGRLAIRDVVSKPTKPNLFLAANGFRLLTSKYGLDGALKLLPSSYRAFAKKTFLSPVLEDELKSLRKRLRKGISDWLADRIRFPRLGWKARS